MKTGLFPNEIQAIEANEAQIGVACEEVIAELQGNIDRIRGYFNKNAPGWHMCPLGDASYAQKVLDELYLAINGIRGDNSTKGVWSIDPFLEKAMSELCLWMAWRKVQVNQEEPITGEVLEQLEDFTGPEPAVEAPKPVAKRRSLLKKRK